MLGIALRKYLTSCGLQTLCNGPETPTPTYLHLPTNLLTGVGDRDAYASKNRGRCANIAIDNVVFSALLWAQDEMPQNVYSFPLKAFIFLIGDNLGF